MREQISLTDRLAEYWANARYEDLPAEVVAAAKRALMDTLSVAVRGAESEIVQITQRGATAMLEQLAVAVAVDDGRRDGGRQERHRRARL